MKSILAAAALLVTASSAHALLDALNCTSNLTASGRFITIVGQAPSYKVTVLSTDGKSSSDYTVESEAGIDQGFEIVLKRVSGTLPATLKLDYAALFSYYTLKGLPEPVKFEAAHCE